MISGFDAFVSISVLAFFLVLLWLVVKSREVRFTEWEGDEVDDEPLEKHLKKAEKMLEETGYQVSGRKRRVRCDLTLNDRVWDNDLKADFTAWKDGRYYVCKVRPESLKELPTAEVLRGELLPLQILYRASGCLYLDLVDQKIHVVAFGGYDRNERIVVWRNRVAWLGAGFLLAVVLG